MDFNKRAGQLEWMSISHEQMVQFICGKYDKKLLALGISYFTGMLMITYLLVFELSASVFAFEMSHCHCNLCRLVNSVEIN